ncbi:MAG: phosphoribosylformylglycinamidine synthase subunit PurQ, partial [Fulvivirga sp.]|uniref:phosphoribosylformylglycinamidine synthase subunit PurQ n=1 Tax=Fulvivirga sp. TaxID=1931237 RepID=UPI0032EB2759
TARLYQAVQSLSEFATELGINIPTGKDSLSMTQKYPDGKTIYSPGTVIISTVAEVSDVTKTLSPNLKKTRDSEILYIDLSGDSFELGGSSFAQVRNKLGSKAPTVKSSEYFKKAFQAIQSLIIDGKILSGHDISAGGMLTALLEMTFANKEGGLSIDLNSIKENDLVKILFSEQPGLILEVEIGSSLAQKLDQEGIQYQLIGTTTSNRKVEITKNAEQLSFNIDEMRDIWYKTSHLLDRKQSGEKHADQRFNNYKIQPLTYNFPAHFTGSLKDSGLDLDRKKQSGIKGAIIREKGVNGDREMAWAMHLAGFDVKDIHMTDLISGREDLSDVNMIAFVGGFSNSDVLGSAKGWAGAFLYNEKAKNALEKFYARKDTLSLGVCNGCQLMMELGLLYPELSNHPKMHHNGSGKFESAFINIDIPKNNSIMLETLSGSKLGVWLAHGEGRFILPQSEDAYNIVSTYSYKNYPGNPNDSDYAAAAVCSKDGRHLAIMPHLERSIYPYNWPDYPSDRADEVSPWIEAFANARKWVEKNS